MLQQELIISDLKVLDVAPFARGGTVFTVDADGRLLSFRLDNAAVSRLLGRKTLTGNLRAHLMDHQGKVCEAAQRLLRAGFWTEQAGSIEVEVTSLDL